MKGKNKDWNNQNRKKWIWKLALLADGIFAVLVIIYMVWSRAKITEMMNRLTYLQDTGSIIQSDVGSLQSDLEQTLREENSLIETWSIDVVDMDFAAGTYQVQISLIPKEYTESTQVSIYFGTTEYALARDGFVFEGTVELPLSQSYAGNVTVLFSNGSKKTTEVLRSYAGYQAEFENILSGELTRMPEYKDGVLSIRDTLEYALEGNGMYTFSNLYFLVDAGEETVYQEELITEESLQDSGEEDGGWKNPFSSAGDEDSTELEEAIKIQRTVDGLYGSQSIRLKEDVEAGGEIRIYLQAVSAEGYTFEYELFSGVAEEGGGFAESERYFTGECSVYDKKGGKYIPES